MMDKVIEEQAKAREKSTPTEQQIAVGLVSDVSCLQNGLLMEQLQQRIGATCQVIRSSQVTDCHCLLLDCNALSREQAQELLLQLAEQAPTIPVALLNATPFGTHENLFTQANLNGIFYHDTDPQQLVAGIKELLNGELWLPRRLLNQFLERNRHSQIGRVIGVSLTKRERQILQCIQAGATNAEISAELFVSEHTIKSHLYNIFKKIGVKNRLEASNWARQHL